MSVELIIILLLGMVLMCIPIGMQMKWYGVSWWKAIPISIFLVLTGIFGSYLWYYVENGHFGGRSLYGVIFCAPVVYWPLAKLLRMPYPYALDFCAPAGCLTLAAVKIQCLRDGCCQGFVLGLDEHYRYIFFPSQIVEMIAFLVVAIVLFILSRKPIYRGKVFPWFLVLYGSSRFVLNFFREISEPYALGLSAGSFWSLCALIIGAVWLYLAAKKDNATKNKVEQVAAEESPVQ